jgi:hypothetical protein
LRNRGNSLGPYVPGRIGNEAAFTTKVGVSNFALTSKVLTEGAWTLDTLKRRQVELIGAIEKLWRLT